MTTDNNLSLSLGGDNPSMPEGFFEETKTFEDAVTSPAQEGDVNQPVGDNQETLPPTDSEDNDKIVLSRKELAKEINRLRAEDKDFAHVYSRDIGNKAAQRYKPEIDALRKQNETLQLALRRLEYSQLPEPELRNRFATDPEFAQDYARVIHTPTPPARDIQPDFDSAVQVAAQRIQSVLAFAERVLPEDKLNEIKTDIGSGKFDVDELGERYSVYNMQEGLDRLENYVANLVRQPIVAAQQTPTPPTSNPSPPIRQDTASPDMSPSGGRGNTFQKFTMQQVREMSIEEKLRRWPGDMDIENAVARGEIILGQ